jgi:uncharacterized protein (TIGR02271 family)
LIAVAVWSELGDCRRFTRSEQLVRHSGLDVSVDASDRHRAHGYLTRQGPQEMRVTKQREATGKVRLRKYVITEHQQMTVPVQREEVRVEREPITEANIDAATRGPDISEAEHEVTTYEERPIVTKETVPKERVRLEKDTVTDTETVEGEVRKEQIEVEGDEKPRRR